MQESQQAPFSFAFTSRFLNLCVCAAESKMVVVVQLLAAGENCHSALQLAAKMPAYQD
jgi:hypothetical protein